MKKALLTLGAALLAMTASAAINNMLDANNSTFENGNKNGWSSWGNDSESSVVEGGYNSTYCLELVNPKEGSDYYAAQAAYTFDDPLAEGEYTFSCWAKSEEAGGSIQIAYQNSTSYSGGGYKQVNLTTDWKQYTVTLDVKGEGMNRVLINFGKVVGTFYVDDIVFGTEIPTEGGFEAPEGYEVVLESKYADGVKVSAWNACFTGDTTHDGQQCIEYTNDEAGNSYSNQIAVDYNYAPETMYYLAFDVMGTPSTTAIGAWFQNKSDYSTVGGYNTFNTFTITSDSEWTQVVLKGQYSDTKEANRIAINAGEYVGTAYFTNFKLYGPKADDTTGINTVEAVTPDAKGVYNLMGVKVAEDLEGVAAGLYIVNGKKVIVRK